jgi:predicted dehydrogenase
MSAARRSPAPLRYAIIGTGGMARSHARQIREHLTNAQVVAAADIDAGRVAEFAREFAVPATFTDPRELLAQVECDAVVIATPDAAHKDVTLAALRAGRHVLCEKPLALNHADARTMAAAAQRAGRQNVVNFSYRDWPAIQAVATYVQSGRIGDVRHVEASYLQSWLGSRIWGDWRKNPAWLWRLSTRHGSNGVLGDIGVHIVDFATFPVGDVKEVHCRLQTFPKAPRNRVGPYVLDANDSAVITVEFANGALGSIHTTRWSGGHRNRLFLKISGTKGAVEIDSEKATDRFRVSRGKNLDTGTWEEITVPRTPTNHQRFAAALRGARPTAPDFARGAAVQKILDACFVSEARRRPVRL